ncbi:MULTISPECIES: hypothetical protein [Actinomyces]|uniref:Uncharacterized protein n=1 Tax=Actinomyces respiraculi TaxID=2744574 RepID=A0A7T0PW40_9ACTO|nr:MULTISPECIES: hypothetical protein [Actinomyces]QPL05349.1 hypothetical protein ID810_11690 [Actinomyces respiraculi]
MARDTDAAVLDSARVRHRRLASALERGSAPGRPRPVLPRLIASLIVAALACAGCVGYSFITTHLDSLATTGTTGTTSAPSDSPAPELERLP